MKIYPTVLQCGCVSVVVKSALAALVCSVMLAATAHAESAADLESVGAPPATLAPAIRDTDPGSDRTRRAKTSTRSAKPLGETGLADSIRSQMATDLRAAFSRSHRELRRSITTSEAGAAEAAGAASVTQ